MVFMTQPVELSLSGHKTVGSWTTELEQVPRVWPEKPGRARLCQNVELGDDKQSNHSASKVHTGSDSWEPGGLRPLYVKCTTWITR